MPPDLSLRGPVVPSLFTPDMAATERFYVDWLGFGRTGEWIVDGAMKWMELKHPTLEPSPSGAAPLTLWFFANRLTGQDTALCSGMIYLMVRSVAEYAQACAARTTLQREIEAQPYGLIEWAVTDNNGYRLVFAEEA